MIEQIRQFFESRIATSDEGQPPNEQQYRLATAALLVEMSRADYETKTEEQETILEVIRKTFELTDDQTRELFELAQAQADASTSLYEFTRLINDRFKESEKEHIVELLWEVAFADGDLDKYEEHLLRRISDLLHVRHRAFVNLKLKVKARHEGNAS